MNSFFLPFRIYSQYTITFSYDYLVLIVKQGEKEKDGITKVTKNCDMEFFCIM